MPALFLLTACTDPLRPRLSVPDSSAPTDSYAGDDSSADTAHSDTARSDNTGDTAHPVEPSTLEVTFLGVGGVALRHGDDLVLTAPLFTNPDMLTVTLGAIASDPAIVARHLAPEDVHGAAAILVGHAHYDHLLDVPTVADMAGSPVVYGNLSARNLLAGLQPVTAVDDPDDPLVDRRMAATTDVCTGLPPGLAGDWIAVPGARVRVRALASMHPDQLLGVGHFAEGCVDAPWAAPPSSAADWLEGSTVAWLVDFLDDEGAIAFRVYHQDSPTNVPLGDVYPELLAERGVDLAILSVGGAEYVRDQPGLTLANLSPRYALGIHWEDFFTTQDHAPVPMPFMADPALFDGRALDALGSGSEAPVLVDGVDTEARYWRPDPGARFSFPAASATPLAEASTFELLASTERSGNALVLRTALPWDVDTCATLTSAPCDDVDTDGLTDAWEDLVLDLLRPVIRFSELEPFVQDKGVLFDVGRVAPSGDGTLRVYVMQGYTSDYGRCGFSAHDGDPERVVLSLAPLAGGGEGDVEVVGLYTAAHEGTFTDHSVLLTGGDLGRAVFEDDAWTGLPRWRVYASDGKHATYPSVELCEAESIVCLEEDCEAAGVLDPTSYDRLPPVINAGEPDAPRWSDLGIIGFPGDDAWIDQEFCGGSDRTEACAPPVRDKLLEDPFAE